MGGQLGRDVREGERQELTITLLGTGTPFPSPDRFGAAILVRAGDRSVVVDAGRGVTIRLQQAGVPASHIRSVFLTHLHSDHVVGLPDLWLTGWILGRYEPLRVWGPQGTLEMTTHLSRAFAADVRIRQHPAENLPSDGAIIKGHDITCGLAHTEGGLRVIAFAVDHGHVTPAFGYRIEHEDRAVVVSGDATMSQDLIDAARGADVMVLSAWLPEGTNPTPAACRSIASAEDAGRVFAAVRPRLGVVYHYLDEAGIEEGVRAHYAGPLAIGRDLMTIDTAAAVARRS